MTEDMAVSHLRTSLLCCYNGLSPLKTSDASVTWNWSSLPVPRQRRVGSASKRQITIRSVALSRY